MPRKIMMGSWYVAWSVGLIGWCITSWTVRAWTVTTASRYQILDYSVNSGTLAYLAGIAISSALLSSLAPVVRVVQFRNLSGGLIRDSRSVTRNLRSRRL